MNKYLKYGLISAAGVVALFLLIILAVSLTFDPIRYEAELVKLAWDKKHRALTLPGDLKLTIFPKPGVDLGPVSLSESRGEGTFAAVDGARLSLSWWHLLRGDLVVDGVRLEGLRADLARSRDGGTNFDDLLQKEELPPLGFAVDSIEVAGGDLHWRDEVAGRELALNTLTLRADGLAGYGAASLEANFRLSGERPRLDLQTHLTAGLLVDGQRYNLRRFNLETTGDAGDWRGWAVGMKGDAELDAGNGSTTLENLALAVTRKHGSADLDIRLTSPSMVYAAENVSARKIDLVGKIQDGRDETSMVLSVPAISGTARALHGELRFEANIHQGDGTAMVKLRSRLAGGLSRLELPGLDIDFVLHHPGARGEGMKARLAGNALLDLRQQSASVDVKGTVDESGLELKLGAAPLARPHFSFDAGIDRIDFDRYPAAARPRPDRATETAAPRWLSADGMLRIGAMRLDGTEARNVRLAVGVADGWLGVSPFSTREGAPGGGVRQGGKQRPDGQSERRRLAR